MPKRRNHDAGFKARVARDDREEPSGPVGRGAVPPVVDLTLVVLLGAAGRDGDEPQPHVLIDKQFVEAPFFGVRQMTWHLQNEGHAVNQKRIRRLMRRGFFCLVAIMGWITRKVLTWRISITREADFCVEALSEAIHRFGQPSLRPSPGPTG